MTTMTISHEAAHQAGWSLARHEVRTLLATPAPRLLLVLRGRVWITETVPPGAGVAAVDHWLGPGHSLVLPAGSTWVAEAQGETRLVLLLPPAPVLRRRGGAGAALRRAWHALTAPPAAPAVPRAP